MKLFYLPICVLVVLSGVYAEENVVNKDDFQNCLEKDSISCVQLTIFRKAKSFFENPKIELFGGLSLDRTPESVRQGKSIHDNEIETVHTVEGRNNVMENYFWDKFTGFLQERSLNLNFANAARSISNSLPDEVKSDLKELVVEGRLRKRKLMRKLMPILMALGAKFALLKLASLFGILFIAKKALIVSILALALAVFGGLGSGLGGLSGRSPLGGGGGGLLGSLGGLFGGGAAAAPVAAVGGSTYSTGVGAAIGSGGWASSGSGWDNAGAYSSHNAAYAAYKPSSRRRR
ncbi:keratin, type II cytoskeletal I [Condylostylus longicornis]|uniref:keratin, type II cytoskeletal I n=1 Tax=Condylostylus longicornis TaxID=2530218 RepID=UPI00244E2CC8|nr:keratin, type II cytoskeletal I [Condylostylus longicornis]